MKIQSLSVRIIRQVGLVSLSLATVAAVATAAQPWTDAPAGKPFVYKTSGDRERRMEVFFPPKHDPATARVPGMILFHGGGWSGGDLGQFREACAYFASRGMVCATAEYRMLGKAEAANLPRGESRKRVCVIDAKSAIRWFADHADEFGIDPEKIIAGGGSAGGHVSALATMNPDLADPTDPVKADPKIAAYVWFNPAFALDDARDPAIDIMQHMNATLPPTIVFFGDHDHAWKPGWDAVHAAWKSAGVTSIDFRIAEGQGHGFFNRDPWKTLSFIAIDELLVARGLLSGKPTLVAPTTGEHFVEAR